MGKIKLSVVINKPDGSSVKQMLRHRRQLAGVDSSKEVMLIDLDGMVIIGYIAQTNPIVNDKGYIKIITKDDEGAEYIDYRKLFGWCYVEESV